MEVFFYHLTEYAPEEALVKLVDKALKLNVKILIRAPDDIFLAKLSEKLWAHLIFHGLENEDFAMEQPILLTTTSKNTNMATLCFFVNGANCDGFTELDKFSRIIVVFNGNSTMQLAQARKQWQVFKNTGFALNYFKQQSDGRWAKQKLD